MGTPEFAVTILDAIIKSGHEVVGVVTVADKPAGRGQQLKESAVKIFAKTQNLPILQPEILKDNQFLMELKAFNADIFVVVAFRMLPEVVWAMPPKGTFNLHASLLPKYRGAAPINWAIINGESETGVTTFFINQVIDTGEILAQEKVSITENMTAGELHDALMNLGATLTVETLDRISTNEIQAIPQDEELAKKLPHAPKIFKADCEIQWNQNAAIIHNKIRGLSPYPTAWCKLFKNGEKITFKLFTSKVTTDVADSKSLRKGTDGILFPCNDFYISISELQPEGKRRMNYKEFLAGNSLSDYSLQP
ncbi:MAG: methionyl-tRNA formyltransferase [Bacteroidetes bacterium]|nr:methionyl-tRNA formyltransferase [Bacteroidota bacterium]